jgi:transposase
MYLTETNLREAIPNHYSAIELAKTFGVSRNLIYDRVRQYGLSLDDLKEHEVGPTPEEIAERAAEIRAGWSEEEEQRRIVGKGRHRWSPPGTLTRV